MATHPALLEALAPPSTPALRKISSTLLASLRTHLQTPNGPTMLPSFTHTLPTGAEPGGTAVAIDLGGSTLRVAVVSIDDAGGHKFLVCGKWGIDDEVKKLPGERFFDYIAERVAGVLEKAGAPHVRDVGITWSFPIM